MSLFFHTPLRALSFLTLVLPVAFAGGALAADAVDRAQVAGFAPHKALYDIKLVGTRSGSQILNISGQMLYEWQSSCEGWTSNHRFDLTYEYADSPAMRITSDFSTYETFDGQEMNFSSQRKRDGQLFEELRGHANVKPDEVGEAAYSIPKDLAYDIPKGGLFPMGHTLGLVDYIKRGKKFYNATIFDGSDDEGAVNVNAFIGHKVNAMANIKPSEGMDTTLLNTPAHQVQLAFFPLSDASPTSDYEMDLVFHDNAIISDMTVKYEDFTVSQKLVALEKIDNPACPSNVSIE